jgi:parvulin-like peptidyl-prolyl isomerase
MGNEVWQAAAANPNVRGPVFAGVAKAKSHGFTADEGGAHDWTPLGSLKCEEMNEALETLALGQMSDGIESELGFHIVRVLERKEAGRTPFTEAQEQICKALEQEQKAALVTAELAKLRENARVWTLFDGDLGRARLAEALDGRRRR